MMTMTDHAWPPETTGELPELPEAVAIGMITEADLVLITGDQVHFTKTCHFCHQPSHVTAPLDGVRKWITGALIQAAMPGLPVGDREILVSGSHPACFDAAFLTG